MIYHVVPLYRHAAILFPPWHPSWFQLFYLIAQSGIAPCHIDFHYYACFLSLKMSASDLIIMAKKSNNSFQVIYRYIAKAGNVIYTFHNNKSNKFQANFVKIQTLSNLVICFCGTNRIVKSYNADTTQKHLLSNDKLNYCTP